MIKKEDNTKKYFNIKGIFKILRYTSAFKKEYFIVFFFLAFQIASHQFIAFSLKYLVNDIIPSKNARYMILYAVAWIIVFCMHSVFTLTALKYRILLNRNLIANLRSEIVKKLQILSIKYFDLRGTGTISTKILMDMDRVQQLYDWIIGSFGYSIIALIISFSFLSLLNPILTVITFLYVPFVPLLQRIFRKGIMKNSYLLRSNVEGLSAKIIDYISGIRHIRIFANEDVHSQNILDEINNVKEADIRYSMKMRVFLMIIQFFTEFVPVCLWVAAGIIMIKNANLTLGAVIAYLAIVGKVLQIFNVFFSSFDQIVAASPSVDAVNNLLENDEVENQNPKITKFEIDGSIKIKNVDFGYETRIGQKQLSNINMEITAGEKIAIVGESGSGKSTFVNVILGLYPITKGNIYFGNYNISDLKLRTLRSQIAVMSQDTFLFNTSIYENIKFANFPASQKDIEEACKRAEIYDFIVSLPDKFNTNTGERGIRLSGGQRQRIGLARVFLRNPKIIILDEPSSAIDVFTEQKLFETLYKNVDGITLIVIAHRISTIRNVDRIFVFENGSIIEEGKYEVLKQGEGIFANILKASIT
ncbi:MAG: ABC transporter ATP-binding protein [Elusimicrobia bacterium]|nr:ABC transporter ATP-binding protein [Elusimicrobiota bacterium]